MIQSSFGLYETFYSGDLSSEFAIKDLSQIEVIWDFYTSSNYYIYELHLFFI